jgi:DNA primase
MNARMNPADLANIVAGIRDRFPMSAVAARMGVKLHRAGNEMKACCPFHADRTPSFTIYADDRRAHCFGCGWSGDVLDLVQHGYRVKLLGAIETLDNGLLRELEQQRAPAKPKADLRPVAQRIVNNSVPIEGTPAEAYLRSRGITMALPHTLRFARLAPPQIEGNGLLAANGPAPLPALIAIVTDPVGALVGLQRTYLTENGCKAATTPTASDRKPKVKYSLGNVAGGAIQLGPPVASLVVTEGLEDGLTLAQALHQSVWVSAGTSMLPRMTLADVTLAVVIGADRDAPGETAAIKAARAFSATGRNVRIMRPAPGFKDFSAELMAGAA